MWPPPPREQHSRTAARYKTVLTDAEWAILAPHMPPPANRGRPRDWTFREIIGGPRGYDAGKKVKDRKRHALVDTDGRALLLFAHPADIQDRDAAGPLLSVSRRFWPFIQKAFADSAYDAKRVAAATDVAVEIVRKHPDQVGFVVQPRRWVVERFFAWINRNRRLAKDVEATIASAGAFLYAASVMLLTRRLARAS